MQRLWRDSPCSYNYITPRHSFDQSDRFGRYSIYYKDNVNKEKRKITNLDNPEMLIKKFRMQIAEASKQRYKKKEKDRKKQVQQAKGFIFKQRQLDALAEKSKTDQIPVLRDRFGFKTLLSSAQTTFTDGFLKTQKNQKILDKFHKNKKDKGCFTLSKRMDFSRPLNFYPSPNTYATQRPLFKKRSVSMATTQNFFRSTKQSS